MPPSPSGATSLYRPARTNSNEGISGKLAGRKALASTRPGGGSEPSREKGLPQSKIAGLVRRRIRRNGREVVAAEPFLEPIYPVHILILAQYVWNSAKVIQTAALASGPLDTAPLQQIGGHQVAV